MSSQPREAARQDVTTPPRPVPMQAQVYVRLRHRLREIEAILSKLRADSLDEDGEPRHVAEHAVLKAQAASLRAIIDVAEVVPIGSRVIVGSTVHVRTEDQSIECYEIVIPTEADPAAGKVSFDSPIGAALLGDEVGDVAVVATPRGDRRLRVMVVRHG